VPLRPLSFEPSKTIGDDWPRSGTAEVYSIELDL
jgi:hypothetical protein